ncbi:MAG: hypothetical protein HZB15_07580 [Actinobacteria bacterium]|nr:hypothetical protein [Actinomycetota bacterium]
MTRWRRWVCAAGVAGVAALAPAQPALAHGGGDATSNYRTRILGVEPAVPGLSVHLFDVQGTIEITYDGPGTLVVVGYEDEPYLRIGPGGVERNVHSPATYLNEDRYARVPQPPEADASLEPEWEQLSSGRTAAFHDHRTHWMSDVPPSQVDADPGEVFVIYPRWEIPLSIDGSPAAIVGDLAWVPPPSGPPWVTLGFVVAAIVGVALAMASRWQRLAVVVAALGSVIFIIDTVGYLAALRTTSGQKAWLIVWPAVAVAATIAMYVVRKRAAATPSAFIALAALVIGAIGGWDRIDVIHRSQIQSSLPDWFARAAAVTCLALGATLLVRFLADLVPRTVRPARAIEPPAG